MNLHPAYIAGFFDGEGHVGHHYNKGSRKKTWSMSFAQNDRRPLDAILESYPGGHIYYHRFSRSQVRNGSTCHNLIYNGRRCQELARAIQPFLIVKYDEVTAYLSAISLADETNSGLI